MRIQRDDDERKIEMMENMQNFVTGERLQPIRGCFFHGFRKRVQAHALHNGCGHDRIADPECDRIDHCIAWG